MSRGPGRIEQAIRAAINADPDNAFTVDDLCDRAFAGINRIEKKHRVSVIRALKAVAARDDRLELFTRPLVLFDPANVMSYAMARLKADSLEVYRPSARKTNWRAIEMRTLSPPEQEARLRSMLMPGGDHHHLVTEGGAWWRHTLIAHLQHAGDSAALAKLEAEQDKAAAGVKAALGAQAIPH